MARKRSLRSQLYRDARILGNIEAAVQGQKRSQNAPFVARSTSRPTKSLEAFFEASVLAVRPARSSNREVTPGLRSFGVTLANNFNFATSFF